MFQEWFDINYATNENTKTILKDYYDKSETKINNRFEAKQNNGELNSNISLNNDNYIKSVSSQYFGQ